jgi:hypothetical protein
MPVQTRKVEVSNENYYEICVEHSNADVVGVIDRQFSTKALALMTLKALKAIKEFNKSAPGGTYFIRNVKVETKRIKLK